MCSLLTFRYLLMCLKKICVEYIVVTGRVRVISSVSSSLWRQVWIRSQESWHNSLAVTISRLNQLLITLLHRVGCTLEIMWPRNFQNVFWTLFVLLWELNPTPSASRAIALPTRPHHPIFIRNQCFKLIKFTKKNQKKIYNYVIEPFVKVLWDKCP